MCFTNKRKRNWIRKEDRILDPVQPLGRVGSGTGAWATTSFVSFAYFMHFLCVMFHIILYHLVSSFLCMYIPKTWIQEITVDT